MARASAERLHKLSPGVALDRRRLHELFMQAAQRAAEIHSDNIASLQIGSNKLKDYAFEEYWFDYIQGSYFTSRGKSLSPYPLVGHDIRIDDPFTMGEITWSIEALTENASCQWLVVFPVVDGHALNSGVDYKFKAGHKYYSGAVSDPIADALPGLFWPESANICLGGKASFIATSGRSPVGLSVFSNYNGEWKILSANISTRLCHR